ncbi:hypothetical protein ACQ4PT_048810 [Festuca glaucescens]
MAEGSMKMASVCSDLTAKLTDDILADIISRLAYKSTCCCRCVSTHWRDLISHPYHRKKMPQSLIGFFHEILIFDRDRSPMSARFTNVSWKGDPLVDPSLSFLPKLEVLGIVDCCNGLVLPRSRITLCAILPLRNGWSCLAPTSLVRPMFAW